MADLTIKRSIPPGLGVPLLDVPMRLISGIKQMVNGAPMEALRDPEPYEQAARGAELRQKYAPQIEAIQNATQDPQGVQNAWSLLGSLNNRAMSDGVRANDWQAVMDPLRQEVGAATVQHLNLGTSQGVAGLGQAAVQMGVSPEKVAPSMADLVAKSAAANASNAKADSTRAMTPYEQRSEGALAGARGAAANADNARAGYYDAQANDEVPSRVNANNALAAARGRYPAPAGGGRGAVDPTKVTAETYRHALADLQAALPKDFLGGAGTENEKDAGESQQNLEARQRYVNQIADTLNEREKSAGKSSSYARVKVTQGQADAKGYRRTLVVPEASDDSGGQWEPPALPTRQPGAAQAGPPQMAAPQAQLPDMGSQQAPQMEAPQQGQQPGDVTDLTPLLNAPMGQGPQAAIELSRRLGISFDEAKQRILAARAGGR